LNVVGLRSAGGVEPFEHLLNDGSRREAAGGVRGGTLGARVELRSAIVEVDRSRLSARGDGVIDAVVDVRNVLRVIRREAIAAVALEVVDHAEAGADIRVIRHLVVRLIESIVLVVASADVKAPMIGEVPLVIDEGGFRLRITGAAQLADRRPQDEAAGRIAA